MKNFFGGEENGFQNNFNVPNRTNEELKLTLKEVNGKNVLEVATINVGIEELDVWEEREVSKEEAEKLKTNFNISVE